MDIVNFLRQVEAFEQLDPAGARHLAEEIREQSYAAGDTILQRGQEGDCMYVLVLGEVDVSIVDEDGERLLSVRLGPKQIFGEMALLTGDPRTADVVANSDCHCLVLEKHSVEHLIREQPPIARFLTTILGHRLLAANGIKQVGKYRLVGELGRGSMGIVYEAIHPTLERPVAIKMLSHELIYRPQFVERFRNEAKIIARLRQPGIVEVFDTEEAYATFFIVMEKLPGHSLEEEISAHGRLDEASVRSILCQLASALEVAHRHGIVHRDVKPSNIVRGIDGQVKLMDFGLALDPEAEKAVCGGESLRVGTPVYMAPEQVNGEPLSGKSDIYSLGIIAYEMLIGMPPYVGNIPQVMQQHINGPVPDPGERRADLAEDLRAFVQKACAKLPSQRFADCGEILRHFGAVERSGPALALAPASTAAVDLEVETLTCVFPPQHRLEVEAALDDCRRRLRQMQGVLLR